MSRACSIAVLLTALASSLAARPALAQDQYTLLVTGASGGGSYTEQHDRWRASLVTARSTMII